MNTIRLMVSDGQEKEGFSGVDDDSNGKKEEKMGQASGGKPMAAPDVLPSACLFYCIQVWCHDLAGHSIQEIQCGERDLGITLGRDQVLRTVPE